MAAVLSMISNLAVNEPGLARLRSTAALIAPPVLVAVAAGTLLAPYRIVADAVFVVDSAADRVRANLEALRHLVHHRGPATADGARSAEDEVDAAEAHAARTADHRRRAELLTAVRLLRRIDQAVVRFAGDLGGVPPGGPVGTPARNAAPRA